MSLLNDVRRLRSSFSAGIQNAKILLALRGAEQAISNHRYALGTHRLESGAASLIAQDTVSIIEGDARDKKKKFASLLVSVSLKSQDIKRIENAADLARRLYPGLKCRGLRDLGGSASERYLISKMIVDAFPEDKCARLHLAINAESADEPADRVALLFTQARDLIGASREEAWNDDLVQGLELRVGVALVKAKVYQDGRRILLALDRKKMSGQELLWLVHGWVRTQKWLDRLRAFDILLDLNAKLAQERFANHELNRQQWASAFYDFLNMLPMKLKSQERDRYEEDALVFATPFLDALLESIAFRNNLEKEDGVLDSIKELILPKEMADVRLAIVSGDVDFLNQSCLELAHIYGKEKELPLALLWPFILKKDLVIETETLALLAEKFAAQARTPSYGWAPLAAKLFALKYHHAGCFIAKRMVVEKEEHDLARRVVESALKQALLLDDESNLLFWLDAFKEKAT